MRDEERGLEIQGKGETKQRACEGNHESVSDGLVLIRFQCPLVAQKEGEDSHFSPSSSPKLGCLSRAGVLEVGEVRIGWASPGDSP